ncbi:MAG TPA: hypothetical protein PKK59_11085 [Anaerolineaceae bacterium]|nr:hypothetical protein [Anaerolineaceae bacterium]
MKTSALPIRIRVRPKPTDLSTPRGYIWKVVFDPTRNGEDPGYFYGHLFRMIDIRPGRDEKATWPDGILFENVLDQCQLTYSNGILIDLTHSRVLSKKRPARIRTKKAHPRYQSGCL